MKEHNHREFRLVQEARRPDIQVQAIFTLTLGARLEHRTGSLRTYRAELLSLSDPRPFSHEDRQPPTAFADRWLAATEGHGPYQLAAGVENMYAGLDRYWRKRTELGVAKPVR